MRVGQVGCKAGIPPEASPEQADQDIPTNLGYAISPNLLVYLDRRKFMNFLG
ncbi:MAG: hypothetical protein PF517_09965 [Salinivirgaceae bacterium]|nr:hypothetical protein [Salinivirgaceae bacterium]